MNKRILLTCCLLGLSSVADAGSVAGFGGSTEITQILNNVELVNPSAQMYQQVHQNHFWRNRHRRQIPGCVIHSVRCAADGGHDGGSP